MIGRTCWLIRSIAMSFRSCVYLSKACSIVETSVLASTTKKFFCESGGCVTCCFSEIRWKIDSLRHAESYSDSSQQQTGHGVLHQGKLWSVNLSHGVGDRVCTSSPMTARKCRSLYDKLSAVIFTRWSMFWSTKKNPTNALSGIPRDYARLFTAQYISFEYKQKASSNAYNKCIISYFYIPCDVPCKIQNVDVRTNVKPRWWGSKFAESWIRRFAK